MVWDHLRNKYYEDWKAEKDSAEWYVIRIKLDMVNDLRELLRKFDNA